MSKINNLVISHENAVTEFEARLRRFDWHYNYSDYHPYWTKCSKDHDELVAIAKSHPDFAEAYDQVKSELAPSDFR